MVADRSQAGLLPETPVQGAKAEGGRAEPGPEEGSGATGKLQSASIAPSQGLLENFCGSSPGRCLQLLQEELT